LVRQTERQSDWRCVYDFWASRTRTKDPTGLDQVKDKVVDTAKDAKDAVKDKADKGVDAVKDVAKDVKDGTKDVIDSEMVTNMRCV
jgi:hypothetical protein